MRFRKGKQTELCTQSEIQEKISKEAGIACSDVFFGYPKNVEQRSIETILSEMPVKAQESLADIYRRFSRLSGADLPTVETALEDYFTTMVNFLEAAEEQQGLFGGTVADYGRAVEELYLLYCVRDKNTNTYLIPASHPIRVLNEQLDSTFEALLEMRRPEKILPEELGRKADNISVARERLAYDTLKEIFDTKKKNRQQMRLYCRNQVYETTVEKEGEWIKAYPFKQIKSNTGISCFRIWEKLTGYQNRCRNGIIKVAVFGELTDMDKWEAESSSLLNRNVTVEWDTFESFPIMGEYYFKSKEQQLYDLSNISDVKELVHKYNIILFLDLNCFFRQYQTEKTVEERNESVNCRWYLDRSKEQKEFKDKAAYYQCIYNHVGLWLNSLSEINSSSFEFDANLFRTLKAASDESTDIYLYIKDSNKIASHNLDYSGLCNDEYYGGKTLLVYKITPNNNENFNKNYKKFLTQSESEAKDAYVSIKFWKLLKSIDNNYCNYVMDLVCDGQSMTRGGLIKALDESFLILKYSVKAEEKQIDIEYDTSFAKELKKRKKCDEIRRFLEELADVALGYALGNTDMYCVRKYFKELLINSVITNARSINDLVFAHIWSQPWMKWRYKRSASEIKPKADSGIVGKHKIHRTIYVLIERLDNLRMRRDPDIRGYFLNVFRRITCPDVDEEFFEETLHHIAECCKEFDHTSSSLFLNSTLIDYREEKNRE